jgi:hypothetical protein
MGQLVGRVDLEAFDRQGIPAYVESTNPANDSRYERLGFRTIGGFAGFTEGSIVGQMWRPVGG